MSLAFVQQLEAVARRIARQQGAAAACWFFAITTLSALGLVGVDWGLGVHEPAGRLALTVTLLVAAAVAWRWSRRGLRRRATPLAVALALEQRYPEHRSLLSSGVEFSRQENGDPTAGSADLRRAVVLRASVAAESIDVYAVVPPQPLRRALAAAAGAALLLLAVAAVSPRGLAAGLARLVNPLGAADYPRRHDLAFRDLPAIVPEGRDLIAELVDRSGQLPESIELTYRMRRDGRWHYDSQTYAASGASSVTVRRPSVSESFQVRAVGGDHRSMPWQSVEVAPPPRVEELTVALRWPRYAGLPPEIAAEPVQALVGSRLEITGRVDAQVLSGELQVPSTPPVPLAIEATGRSFRATTRPLATSDTGEWSLAFRTARGLTAAAARQLRVEVRPDAAPSAEIVLPVEHLSVTPQAVVDFRLAAADDLGVRSLGLELRIEGRGSDADLASEVVERYAESFRGGDPPAAAAVESEHALPLAELALPVGSSWEVYARAEDYAGQRGASLRPLRLRVISPAEFLRLAEAELARLNDILAQAAADQRSAARRVEQWQATPQQPPTPEEAAALVERQRQLRETLAGERDSALAMAGSLVDHYQRNRWPDVAAAARVGALADELQAFATGELAAAEAALASWERDVAQAAAGQPLAAAQHGNLERARAETGRAADALERLLETLAQFGQLQRLERDVAELHQQQSALEERTAALARSALGGPPESTRSDQSEPSRQAAAEQRELASRLGQSLERAEQAAASLAESNPADAASLQSAAAQASQSRAQAEARSAAELLAEQQFGQAAESQRKAREAMERMLGEFARGGGALQRLDAALKRLVMAQGAVAADVRQSLTSNSADHDGRPAAEQVAAVTRRQAAVREQTSRQAAEVPGLPVFAALLRAAADTMGNAEAELAARGVSDQAVALAARAESELQRLAEAVHEEGRRRRTPSPPAASKPNGQQPPRPQVTPEQLQAMQLTLAQLGLLRSLQADVHRRTAELEEAVARGEVSETSKREQSAALAGEQQRLAGMAEQLRAAAAELPAVDSGDNAAP